LWVSNHIFVKPVANKLSYVDAAEIDSRINDLPGEISIDESLSRSQPKP
jgi:hypothetical protein